MKMVRWKKENMLCSFLCLQAKILKIRLDIGTKHKFYYLIVHFFRQGLHKFVPRPSLPKSSRDAMTVCLAFIFVVAFSTLISTTSANTDVIESLIQAYSTGEGDSKSYFSTHGKAMFEQASMLDAMALAKRGNTLEAADQLSSLAVQSILADLPLDYQAAGDLLNLMQTDRSLFKDTMAAVRDNLKTVSDGIKQKLTDFKSTSKTEADKRKVQGEIKDSVEAQGKKHMYVFSPVSVFSWGNLK